MPKDQNIMDQHRGILSRGAQIWLSLVVLVLALVAWRTPPNLLMNDQEKVAGYVADILHNGTWLLQRDQTGDVASKPPLQNWLAALSVMAVGRDAHGLMTEGGLRLPSMMAVLATGALILGMGRQILGVRAAWLAALAFLMSMPALRMAGLVRTDPLFVLLVTGAALGVWRMRVTGKGWGWVAGLLLLSVMTKGPLGLLLASLGLLGLVRWRGEALDSSRPWSGDLRRLGLAMAVAAVGTLVWFGTAMAVEGQDVWNKLIGRELVGLATKSGEDGRSGGPLSPWLYLIPRWAPWSVVVLVAVVQIVRFKDLGAAGGFLRFCLAWFLGGMAVFMVGRHHRMDHLYPLLPAAAFMAGWALDRWLASPGWPKWAARGVLGVGAVLFVGSAVMRFQASDLDVRRSVAARGAARDIVQRTRAGEEPQYLGRNVPQAVQFYLGLNRQNLDHDSVALALMQTSETLVLSRERGARSMTLGLEGVEGLATLWGADLSEDQEEGETDGLWNMGLVLPNPHDRPTTWTYLAHRAIGTGETTRPLLIGPIEVVRSSKRVLVINSGDLRLEEIFPVVDPEVEVVHGEDWGGLRYPALPLSRPFAGLLFVVAWGGLGWLLWGVARPVRFP